MTSQWLIPVVALACLLGVCGQAVAGELSSDAKQAANDANDFGLDLYGRLAAQEKGNIFLSPYSIETALAMTYAGARGPTAQQMVQVLHLNLSPDKLHGAFADLIHALNQSGGAGNDKAFELVVANALWAQHGLAIDGGFLDLVKGRYGAGLESLDFAGSAGSLEQSRVTINDWVAKQTHDKIKDLISKGLLTRDTRLVLTNAIYFKSAWMEVFKKSATQDESFQVDATTKATVSMMHQSHRFGYMENADLQAVQLPYTFNKLSMVVLLPRQMDGLPALEKSFTAKELDGWMGAMAQRQVELSLPKFTFTSHFMLSQTLRSMGMEEAFSPHGDFSGICTTDRLYLQEVIHQAFVDVNEEGTEAAAATAVVMRSMAMQRITDKVVFRADHPFLFLIRDNASGAILFLGRVNNPKG